ncbi:MAG: tRNA (guanosine(37)-N1)-methyltransferase TrmD [Anaerolineae bacterium]|nr:MAG: tRNA (guanosine(37)-N1)-methyltransferase TrmD [Anaerolineae bacterium]
MKIEVFTLFPEVMMPYLSASILGKAQEAGLVEIGMHNIRDYTLDRHSTTDDQPYGGGGGMVMKPEPLFAAVETVLGEQLGETRVVLLTPQGRVFKQSIARELASLRRIALISGRYEGVDERVREHLADDEISIGDYVLTGGELPALVVIDAVVRLLPGALGDEAASTQDSHSEGLLEGPHYTRPAEYRGWKVPEILRSGDHAKVAAWRRQQSYRRTKERRPELLEQVNLSPEESEEKRQTS